MLDHFLLLVLYHYIEKEAAPKMEDSEAPEEANAVLFVEWLDFPVYITHWILEEAGNIFKRSPPLGVVTGFLCLSYEFAEVAISVFSQSSNSMQ